MRRAPKRSVRRHHAARKKAAICRMVRLSWRYMREEWITPSFIGHLYSTHGRPCSCFGCARDGRSIGDQATLDAMQKEIADYLDSDP